MRVSNQHFEPLAEGIVDNFSIFDVMAFGKRNAVRQTPRIALAGDGAKLVGDGQALFVRSDNCDKKFSGEFAPEMVEKILHRAADAAMIIGRSKNDDVGGVNAGAKGGVARTFVGGIGIVKRERFFGEIEGVHYATFVLQLPGDVMKDRGRDGFLMEAANDSEDLKLRF